MISPGLQGGSTDLCVKRCTACWRWRSEPGIVLVLRTRAMKGRGVIVGLNNAPKYGALGSLLYAKAKAEAMAPWIEDCCGVNSGRLTGQPTRRMIIEKAVLGVGRGHPFPALPRRLWGDTAATITVCMHPAPTQIARRIGTTDNKGGVSERCHAAAWS